VTGTVQPQLFGRDHDLASIGAFLSEIGEGFSVLALEGEAGIGKTTLWEAALNAAADGLHTLVARPSQAETALSFVGLNDLLSSLDEDTWSELPRSQRWVLDAALARTETETAVESGAVAIGFLSLIRALARQDHVLIGVDDYQWLDRPTARVLEFALRRLNTEPVRAVITSRPHAARMAGLQRTLGQDRLVTHQIGPLSLGALYHLTFARFGVSLGRPTLLRVQETSGGNPFFALELTRELLEHTEEEHRGRPLPLPTQLNDLLRKRIDRQPARVRRHLATAAALSSPRVEDLDRINAQLANQDVRADLEIAQHDGLIEIRDGAIRFSHPMLAAAAYAVVTPTEQRHIHRQLAQVVADPEEQARHLALGSDGPNEEVAALLTEAGSRAQSRGATEVAARFAEEALELTPPDRRNLLFERALTAGDLALSAGHHPRARALFERAEAIAIPGAERATALLRRAELASPLREGIALCVEALSETSEPPIRSRIQRTLGAISYSLGNVAEAESYTREGVRLAEQGDDPRALGMALAELGHWTFCGGGGVRDDLFERAVDLDRSAGAPSPRSHRAKVTMDSGDLEGGRHQLDHLLLDATAEGDLRGVAAHHLHLAELEMWAGNWQEAIDHADESLLLHEFTDQPSAPRYVKAMSEACLGQIEPARQEAEIGLAEAQRSENVVLIMQTCHVLGFIELSLGNPGAAQVHLHRATDLLAPRWNREFGDARFVPDEVESLVVLGDTTRAEELTQWMERVGEATGRPWTLATGARCRAQLLAAQGKLEEGQEASTRALDHHHRVPMPFELGRTLLVKGTLERRRKQRAVAADTLQQAHDIFAELGSPLWANRAQGELERIGVRSQAQPSLTPVEERIARLASQGHNNREIGDLLFISRKTVEANLTHIYRKLGIRSRAQLGGAISHSGSGTTQS